MKLPEIPDNDADFTPDMARKIIAKYQAIIAMRNSDHDALVKALETIRDAFWTDGKPQGERIIDLKEIAADALRAVVGGSRND